MEYGRKPFRFGVQFDYAKSSEDFFSTARRIEELGYDILVMADHIGFDILGYGPALMAAAATTTKLRIGTLVLDNDFRHPVIVASEAATLDLLSNGRFELGLGAGHLLEDYERSGIPFDAPGVRVDRLQESVQIIKRFFSTQSFDFAGEHFNIRDLEGLPAPVQSPYPPILIGAGGPRMLAFAAREADIVALLPPAKPDGGISLDIGAEFMDRQVDRLQEACPERFDHLELNMLVQRFVITNDRDTIIDDLAGKWGLSEEIMADSPHILIGTIPEIIDMIQLRRERFELSYYVVREPEMETFAPVVELLAGI